MYFVDFKTKFSIQNNNNSTPKHGLEIFLHRCEILLYKYDMRWPHPNIYPFLCMSFTTLRIGQAILLKQTWAEVELERNFANDLQLYLIFYLFCVLIFLIFALKIGFKDLKFESCQFKLE